LVKKLLDKATEQHHKKMAVLAYPDQKQWHPIGLYQKCGFQVKKIEDQLYLMVWEIQKSSFESK